METLPHQFPNLLSRVEYLYPFLDKDLVNFLFSVPREQLLRPGRRRSLMRRSLRDIVTPEVLERSSKAYQLRAPIRALQDAVPMLLQSFAVSELSHYGLIDLSLFRNALLAIAHGEPTWWQAVIRTISLELWLRSWQRRPYWQRVEEAGS